MNNIEISIVKKEDMEQILEIYSYYVLNSTATFEIDVPNYYDFAARVTAIQEKYPYICAKKGGSIIGFAYASHLRARPAYDYACETTIYLHHKHTGLGTGSMLYDKLFEYIKKQNIINIYACITKSNRESVLFHEKKGFLKAGHFHKCGYKNNEWLDVLWLEKIIGTHANPPKPFINFNDLI